MTQPPLHQVSSRQGEGPKDGPWARRQKLSEGGSGVQTRAGGRNTHSENNEAQVTPHSQRGEDPATGAIT